MSIVVNESKLLISIERFVENVAERKIQPRNFYNDLTDLLIQLDQIYDADFYYSAPIGAFIEMLLDMDEYLDDREQLLDRLNDLSFIDIQQIFKKHYRRHNRELRDHRSSESRNTKILVQRMKKISDRYSEQIQPESRAKPKCNNEGCFVKDIQQELQQSVRAVNS